MMEITKTMNFVQRHGFLLFTMFGAMPFLVQGGSDAIFAAIFVAIVAVASFQR